MKRILLYSDNRQIDRQAIMPTDYYALWENWSRTGGNVGNKVFLRAVEQYLTKPDIQLGYYRPNMTAEEINQNYDMVVDPEANLFNMAYIQKMESRSFLIEKLKIPFYVVGIGIQADKWEQGKELAKVIKNPAQRFIYAVYSTGGEIGTRGYITKEWMDIVCHNSAEVIGCPSMYQKGRDLTIDNKKVGKEEFRCVINGHVPDFIYDKKLQTCIYYFLDRLWYMDQDEFIKVLYCKELEGRKNISIKEVVKLLYQYNFFIVKELLCQGKVKLIYDLKKWEEFLLENQISFSFGSRIHGNIWSILNQIPAIVWTRDLRTYEMADFYKIPYIQMISSGKDLYDMYMDADYTAFNKGFGKKFDYFEEFLVKHNITYNISDNAYFCNKYGFLRYENACVNKEYLLGVLETLGKYTSFFQWVDKMKTAELELKVLLRKYHCGFIKETFRFFGGGIEIGKWQNKFQGSIFAVDIG